MAGCLHVGKARFFAECAGQLPQAAAGRWGRRPTGRLAGTTVHRNSSQSHEPGHDPPTNLMEHQVIVF